MGIAESKLNQSVRLFQALWIPKQPSVFYKGPDTDDTKGIDVWSWHVLTVCFPRGCGVGEVSAPFLRKRLKLQVFCVRLRKGKEGEKVMSL